MFKQLAGLLGLYCLMGNGGCRTLHLLTSKNTNRKERPEVALLIFMAGCYLLARKTSRVWIGVLGCSGLVKGGGIITKGCERQTLSKETLRLLNLHSFGFVVQKTLNSRLICLMLSGFVLQRLYHGT